MSISINIVTLILVFLYSSLWWINLLVETPLKFFYLPFYKQSPKSGLPFNGCFLLIDWRRAVKGTLKEARSHGSHVICPTPRPAPCSHGLGDPVAEPYSLDARPPPSSIALELNRGQEFAFLQFIQCNHQFFSVNYVACHLYTLENINV